MENLNGQVLGDKYKLLELLAEGGMAFIYKAQHLFLKDLCAVKIIKKSELSQNKLLQRFEREAQMTRHLARRSPYIISIHDFGVANDIGFYYVMELLRGYPLSMILSRKEGLPSLAWCCRILAQACQGLAVVHEAGLVHRDIKADNIFIHWAPNQKNETVKLLDFGIVRPIYTEGTGLTTYGRVMGTPEYMSPEQCKGPTREQHQRGVNHLDGRSDIYALGILFYECLTGSVPWPLTGPNALAPAQVMAGHVMNDPLPPHEKVPARRIPVSLSNICMRALAKRPEDRYQTMIEFKDAIVTLVPEAGR